MAFYFLLVLNFFVSLGLFAAEAGSSSAGAASVNPAALAVDERTCAGAVAEVEKQLLAIAGQLRQSHERWRASQPGEGVGASESLSCSIERLCKKSEFVLIDKRLCVARQEYRDYISDRDFDCHWRSRREGLDAIEEELACIVACFEERGSALAHHYLKFRRFFVATFALRCLSSFEPESYNFLRKLLYRAAQKADLLPLVGDTLLDLHLAGLSFYSQSGASDSRLGVKEGKKFASLVGALHVFGYRSVDKIVDIFRSEELCTNQRVLTAFVECLEPALRSLPVAGDEQRRAKSFSSFYLDCFSNIYHEWGGIIYDDLDVTIEALMHNCGVWPAGAEPDALILREEALCALKSILTIDDNSILTANQSRFRQEIKRLPLETLYLAVEAFKKAAEELSRIEAFEFRRRSAEVGFLMNESCFLIALLRYRSNCAPEVLARLREFMLSWHHSVAPLLVAASASDCGFGAFGFAVVRVIYSRKLGCGLKPSPELLDALKKALLVEDGAEVAVDSICRIAREGCYEEACEVMEFATEYVWSDEGSYRSLVCVFEQKFAGADGRALMLKILKKYKHGVLRSFCLSIALKMSPSLSYEEVSDMTLSLEELTMFAGREPLCTNSTLVEPDFNSSEKFFGWYLYRVRLALASGENIQLAECFQVIRANWRRMVNASRGRYGEKNGFSRSIMSMISLSKVLSLPSRCKELIDMVLQCCLAVIKERPDFFCSDLTFLEDIIKGMLPVLKRLLQAGLFDEEGTILPDYSLMLAFLEKMKPAIKDAASRDPEVFVPLMQNCLSVGSMLRDQGMLWALFMICLDCELFADPAFMKFQSDLMQRLASFAAEDAVDGLLSPRGSEGVSGDAASASAAPSHLGSLKRGFSANEEGLAAGFDDVSDDEDVRDADGEASLKKRKK